MYKRDSLFPSESPSPQNLGVTKGIKIDGKNHNWLLFEEYLSMPFSYVTFMIRDKLDLEKEQERIKNFQFNMHPFNYVFNKSSGFMDGNLVTDDHLRLNRVLDQISRISNMHLGILNYMTLTPVTLTEEQRIERGEDSHEVEDPNSALHIAVKT